MLVPSLDESRRRFALAVSDRVPAFLGEGDQLQSLFQCLSIRRTMKTFVETDRPQAGEFGLAFVDHAHDATPSTTACR